MSVRSSEQILRDEFLVARAKIIELAAFLDRLERSAAVSGSSVPKAVSNIPMREWLAEGVAILQDQQSNKAARVQLLMSRPYDPSWPQSMQVRLGPPST